MYSRLEGGLRDLPQHCWWDKLRMSHLRLDEWTAVCFDLPWSLILALMEKKRGGLCTFCLWIRRDNRVGVGGMHHHLDAGRLSWDRKLKVILLTVSPHSLFLYGLPPDPKIWFCISCLCGGCWHFNLNQMKHVRNFSKCLRLLVFTLDQKFNYSPVEPI